jgi:phytanoyl-CoA dioxygenase PhyH
MDDSTPPGSLLDEVAILTERNRTQRSAHLDMRLRRVRHEAYFELPMVRDEQRTRAYADPFPELSGRAPEITAAEFSVEVLGGAIQHHGCLIVRGLFAPTQVAPLLEDVDRSLAARDAFHSGRASEETTPWYMPFMPGMPGAPLNTDRLLVNKYGGMLVADSPTALFNVIDMLDAARVKKVVEEYLGEPLALAVNKCVFRRVAPDAGASWHQDGSFLGHDARTVDVWVALSHCGPGTHAPGLEIVPRRLEEVLAIDENDMKVQHALNSAQVAEALDGLEPQQPTFAPGDAMLFDHLFLHTTASRSEYTSERYALEAWIFTPSGFPTAYVPLAL